MTTRRINGAKLNQRIKREKDFLKWMSRRYQGSNPDQAAAFITGARLLEEIRGDIQAGIFDIAGPGAGRPGEEVFTRQVRRPHLNDIEEFMDLEPAPPVRPLNDWTN